MPLPAPRPLDALRQLTRAVILTAEGCSLSDDLRTLAVQSGVSCEFVDHPLTAIAALVGIEREGRAQERAALVVAERQIDDLDGLFATIRSRMQRISIWVFEAEIAIEVQRGHVPATIDAEPRESVPRMSPTTAPALRITRVSEPAPIADAAAKSAARADAGAEPAEDPPGPSGNTVTPEELEMLLDLLGGDRPPRSDGGGAR